MKKNFVLFLLLALALSGCDSERNQILSEWLRTPTPTATEVPPTATPTATATLPPTPVPTEPPIPDYYSILDNITFGDFDKARKALTPYYDETDSDKRIAEAAYALARIAEAQGDPQSCIKKLRQIDLLTESSDILAPAYYLYATCQEQTENYAESADALKHYILLRPETSLKFKLYQRLASDYEKLDDYAAARNYYLLLLDLKGGTDESGQTLFNIANTYQYEADYNRALELYREIIDGTYPEEIKVQAKYRIGFIYQQKYMPEQAYTQYQDLINNYPKYYESFLALVELINAGQYVSDYQRGLVNYYSGNYAKAAESFHRYIKAEPGHDGSGWYFIGICEMYMGHYPEAVKAFETLIKIYPNNRYYASAYDELSYVQWIYQKQYKKAADTLLEYVKLHPDSPDAANFLFTVGNILEQGNYLTEAAVQLGRLIDEYPLYENSKTALFKSAICYYRGANYDSALAALNRLSILSAIPHDRAQTHFWLAKTYQQKGDEYNYKKNLEAAAKDAPTDFYSFRAQEYLNADMGYAETGWEIAPYDLEREKAVADQWMMLTFSLEADEITDYSYHTSPDYLEGMEYLSLGEYELALYCFENLRDALQTFPGQAYAFLDELVQKKMYYNAALLSRQILTSAGLFENARTMSIPNYFNRIRYGLWYSEYVLTAAREYEISPYILYGMIKQESGFDPWIVSSSGARGLLQIMPDTGQEISKLLHWPENYSENDLNRVEVSANFGASYLNRFYNYFDHDIFAMLASYNAGPGNTAQWTELTDDPDLFTEIVRYTETRNYIQNVYENAKIYEQLYAN